MNRKYIQRISCKVERTRLVGLLFSLLFLMVQGTLAQQAPQLLTEEQQVRSRFIEGCTEFIREAYDKAETIFLEVIEKDPENAASHYYLGRIYRQQKRFSQAVVSTKKARQLDPNTQLYQVALREIYQETGAIQEAISVQDKIVEQYPEDFKQQLLSLSLLKEARSWEKAKQRLSYIESKFDTGSLLDGVSAEIFKALGEDGAEPVAKGKKNKPDSKKFKTEGVAELYNSYMSEGKSQEALQVLEKALAEDPNDIEAQWLRTNYFLAKEGGVDSIQFSTFILPVFTSKAIPLIDKVGRITGEGQTLSLQPDQLDELIRALVEAHPEEAETTRLRGDVFFLNQQYDSAFAVYKSIVIEDPAQVTAWERLLESAEQSEDYTLLYAESEEAMSFFPNSSTFLTHYAMASVRTQRWDQALYSFNKLERLPAIPKELQAKSKREWAYMDYLQGSFEEALKKITDAQALEANSWGYELAGDILRKLGREKEAREQWELAIKNGARSLNIQEKLAQ